MSIIINSTQPYIFIHIPKTAGKSVTETLKTKFETHIIPNDRTINSNYHSTINDAKSFVDDLDLYYRFTIVRNPWDRLASWYSFRKNLLYKSLKKMRKTGYASKVSYKSSEEILKEIEVMELGLYQWLIEYKDRPWDFTWFSPTTNQNEWIRKEKIDKIIKYENLNNELYDLEIFQNLELQELNISSNRKNDFRELYNKRSVDLVKRIYEEDIEMFKYSFD